MPIAAFNANHTYTQTLSNETSENLARNLAKMKWDYETDIKLLVTIVHLSPNPIPWATVAEVMNQFYPGVTLSAIKHRVARLKEQANLPNVSPSPSPRKSSTNTPTRGKRVTTTKITRAKRTPKKAKGPTPEPETSEPETPEFADESESESESDLNLAKEEDGDLINEEYDDLVKGEDADMKDEKEEGEC